jgi:hypothetical protein
LYGGNGVDEMNGSDGHDDMTGFGVFQITLLILKYMLQLT